MSDSAAPKKLCSARALYLGCSVPLKTAVGIEAVQEPLSKLYPKNLKAIKAIDVRVYVYQNGLKIEYVQSATHQGEWYPMSNLYVAAAIKHDAKKVACGYAFAPLDNPMMKKSTSPPVFAAIYRRPTGVKVLECHAFICQVDAECQGLVNACTLAYRDKEAWKLPFPFKVPQPVLEKLKAEPVASDLPGSIKHTEDPTYSSVARRSPLSESGSVASRAKSEAVHEFEQSEPSADVVNVSSDYPVNSFYGDKDRAQSFNLEFKESAGTVGSNFKESEGAAGTSKPSSSQTPAAEAPRSPDSTSSQGPDLPPRRYQEEAAGTTRTSRSSRSRPSPMVFQASEESLMRSGGFGSARGTWGYPPPPPFWYGPPPQPITSAAMQQSIASQSALMAGEKRDSTSSTRRGFPPNFPMFYPYPFPMHPPEEGERATGNPLQFPPAPFMPFYPFYPPPPVAMSVHGTLDSRGRHRGSPQRQSPYPRRLDSPHRMEQSPSPRYVDDYVNRRPSSPMTSLRASAQRASSRSRSEEAPMTQDATYATSFPSADTDREWFTEDEQPEKT